MQAPDPFASPVVLGRRRLLALGGLGVASWLTPVGEILARSSEKASPGRARSVILLWLAGGPSQLETFDPHPNTKIAAGTGSIRTAVRGIELASGFDRLAAEMRDVALIRSMVSPEGDHERGTYTMKTGYRPDPTVVHPSIGAICCHALPTGVTDIPRHVAILAGQWPGRGGFLGAEYDAFQVDDPGAPLRDMTPRADGARDRRRLEGLDLVERNFARGRGTRVAATGHRDGVARARRMMTSDQLRAFQVNDEPAAIRAEYGDNPFGRGCLAARRLIEVGVRCVEVTLGGWDTHVNNHEVHRRLTAQLDPAFAALVADLRRRDLLGATVVACAGEFGRSPRVNLAGGRDHWPRGFSLAIAGGGIRGGIVRGATDPEGIQPPSDPTTVEDVHATILAALGLDPAAENIAPATGRPVKLSPGKPIPGLLA